MAGISVRFKDWLETKIADRCFPGAVVGVVDRSGHRQLTATGRQTYQPDSPQIGPSTPYDVASVTKSVVTTTLALQLVDAERLFLDEPIVSVVPELATRWRQDITIKHLLTQTAVWRIQLSRLRELSGQEILERLLAAELIAPPGTVFEYTNAASVVLGLVVKRVTRSSLASLAQRKIFGPLGMDSATFDPQRPTISPTEQTSWRGLVQGEAHDESAWKLRQIMTPGSAGLFCNALDILKFASMMLGAGLAVSGDLGKSKTSTTLTTPNTQENNSNHWVLSPSTINQLSQNQLPPDINDTASLGWELNQAWMGRGGRRRIGKTGFTGCCLVIDFDHQLGMVMLSNATYPDRPLTQNQKNQLRAELCNIVFASTL